MIDTLSRNLERARARQTPQRLGVLPRRYVYVTLHRPSNVDASASLAAIVSSLVDVSRRAPVVFPVHPRTRQRLEDFSLVETLTAGGGVRLIEPVGYLDSISLAESASCVLTDSGGLQEETTFLRVPCLTLRPNTERPITITEGSNRLTTLDRLREDLAGALSRRDSAGALPCPALWDGKASERVADALLEADPPPVPARGHRGAPADQGRRARGGRGPGGRPGPLAAERVVRDGRTPLPGPRPDLPRRRSASRALRFVCRARRPPGGSAASPRQTWCWWWPCPCTCWPWGADGPTRRVTTRRRRCSGR